MNFRDFFTITTWWGKLLGAFFGYLSAGPLGALLGILIGNFFDRGLISHFSNPHFLYHAEKQKVVQKTFFEATFSVMGHIAKADGHVSTQEINMATLLMDEMRLNPEQKRLAKHLFNEGKKAGFNLDTTSAQLKKICGNKRDLLKLFIDIQYRASQVDGLSTSKIEVLNRMFTHLGFTPLHQQYRFYEDFNYTSTPHYQEPWGQQSKQSSSHRSYQSNYTPSLLDQAYALLEIDHKATKQEIKQAYRRLLSRNHPDKLIAQGLPEEMIKIANDKTQKITKAYELINKDRGW